MKMKEIRVRDTLRFSTPFYTLDDMITRKCPKILREYILGCKYDLLEEMIEEEANTFRVIFHAEHNSSWISGEIGLYNARADINNGLRAGIKKKFAMNTFDMGTLQEILDNIELPMSTNITEKPKGLIRSADDKLIIDTVIVETADEEYPF